ncbi:hypothetical protein ASE01_03710 [Nocardioides sp. Root190]|uniref:hypothetical protein n=1 Tax=Nocardioides sp. Root190 TaxID=1736488 RepID=UPI0006F2657A|nr:hypothetical protein [Nocardioides sp. Root190]KRB78392.1 hypothetical protein ASE01_03710 [Nocardioides sp. Root190]
MTFIKRPLAAAGATALLALSLSACGGGAPTDASKKDFCGGLADVVAASTAISGEEPDEKEWTTIQEAYADLGDIGTPEGIGEAERNGFEVTVEAIEGLDYDEAKKSFGDEDGSDSIPGVSKDEEKDVDKFSAYATKNCEEEITKQLTDDAAE